MDVDEIIEENNLPALGRFAPGSISGIGTTQLKVTLKTNLAGEPIRFTMHESLSSIVSSATLVMLNADISELGETTKGPLATNPTEEDMARWPDMVMGASVEPNQKVEVW
jgi:hypothetical protein